MRRMPCRRYKHQDSAHELAMSPLNLSRVLSMAVNPLASHPDQVVLTSRAMWKIVLFRDRKRESQRAKGLFRAVIGMQDSAELPEMTGQIKCVGSHHKKYRAPDNRRDQRRRFGPISYNNISPIDK